MKTNKSLAFMALISTPLFALALSSCGGGGGNSHTNTNDAVYVCVYDGGYGTEWIDQIAKDYEAATGIKVEWDADESLLDRIEDQLNNASDYDIYMSHDINWQAYAAQGLLANLDDLYASEVEGTGGQTFEERNLDLNLEYSRTQGEDGVEHYFKVNYTQGAGGIIYNIDMFEENGWSVPTTYNELVTLCQTIVDAEIEVGERQTLVPFAWSGSDRQYYWDYIVFEWWAQLAGLDKVNQVIQYLGPDSDGNLTKYENGYEMYNPDTYYKEFIDAYGLWYDLIAEHPEYSNSGAQGVNLASAQALFANGQAAMIPYAQWAKLEISNVTDTGELDFDIAFMNTPTAPNAVETTPVNYLVGYGDSMVVPANAQNLEGAKDFLRYLATYEACATFVEKADGPFLAFEYDNVNLDALTSADTYTASVAQRVTENTCFTLASMNPITVWNSNKVMPWINNEYYYASAMTGDASAAPEAVGDAMYNAARQGWAGWLRNAGL